MDSTGLLLSVLFGTIGCGFFMYGKKAGRIVLLVAGALLMVCPYFIPNDVILTIVCIALTIIPLFLPSA